MTPVIAILCDLRNSYSRTISVAATHAVRLAGFRPVIAGDPLLNHPKFRVLGYVGFVTPILYETLQRTGVPVVNVSQAHASSPFANVFPDNREAGRLAARHLLERGYNQIVFVPHGDLLYSQLRGEGAAAATQHAGGQFQVLAGDRDSWSAQLAKLPRPVGIVGGDDTVAVDLLESAAEIGALVPEQVAIVGITNDEIACSTTVLPLSSVDLNAAEIGKRAAEVLVKLLRGRAAPARPVLVQPHAVVVRASSDALATADKLMADIIEYARTHLHEGVSVAAIARHFGMSRRHLGRIFRERTNSTPLTMLQHLAVAQAKHLLANSELSIAQVAARCGYDNLSHFGMLFRKLTDTTPAMFRRQLL